MGSSRSQNVNAYITIGATVQGISGRSVLLLLAHPRVGMDIFAGIERER